MATNTMMQKLTNCSRAPAQGSKFRMMAVLTAAIIAASSSNIENSILVRAAGIG